MTIRIPSISMRKFLKKEINNSKNILDIGCGDGVMAFYLISSLNCRVDGVDLDKGKVHRANEKFRKRVVKGLALCYFCDSKDIDEKFNAREKSPAFKLEFVLSISSGSPKAQNKPCLLRRGKRKGFVINETFDAVLIIHALHHLTDIGKILSKIKYVLKIDGKILIGEYERNFGEKHDNCPGFSSKKIKSMLNTARFRDIRNHKVHNNFVIITAKKGGIKTWKK